MEKESRPVDPYGQSRTREGEILVGNFPIEVVQELRKKGEKYVNEEVQRMKNSGEWEGVRTDQAYNESGEIIIGQRAIFATPKS